MSTVGKALKINLRWAKRLRQLSSSLSVRAGIYCVGAVATALVAGVLAPFVPDELARLLGGDAVDRILQVLSTSMLAVVTFSLSTLIASYTVAGSSAPFRATALILKDRSAQVALSTFLGAFIFSVVSLVALSTHYYGPQGRVILFFVSVLVLATVIWRIIRWIGRLSGLGHLGNVIQEVERAAVSSIREQPYFFAPEESAGVAPAGAVEICAEETGFVQGVDLEALSALADELGWDIYLEATPGKFTYPGFLLAKVAGPDALGPEDRRRIRDAFLFGRGRTFEEDPRFGFVVLSEIASQALSPGINDPGTAILVISSLGRMLTEVRGVIRRPRDRRWSPRLHPRAISIKNVFEDAFHAIARDGAAFVEVQLFLQRLLSSLGAEPEFREAALTLSRQGLERARDGLKLEVDFQRVGELALANRPDANSPRIS